MDLSPKKKIIIGCFVLLVILISGYLYYDYINSTNIDVVNSEDSIIKENELKNKKTEETDENIIIVHIAGAVNNPGIVKINEGARLYEAIEKAGGSKEDADLSKINLAYFLSDGQKIYIPKVGEVIAEQVDMTEYIISGFGYNDLINEEIGIDSGGEKVNINTANQTELETLPGIGPSTAQKIIEYRTKNKKFSTIEDIQNVKGIGDGKFDEIKDKICV